ncbi:MAG: type II toxin-antitoxin system HicB family antitoxin [bacterium]|nr:type II toxin-antitoxin system HicB family antitoxin [bacterium]
MEITPIKKQIYQYSAMFEPDTESGGYTVTIPALPGCNSEGDTFEEALGNIKEAAELYLEVMKERNENILFQNTTRYIIAPVEVTA